MTPFISLKLAGRLYIIVCVTVIVVNLVIIIVTINGWRF